MITVDYRWKNIDSEKPLAKEHYVVGVSCSNCGEKHIGMMGKGEPTPLPRFKMCPFCGVRQLYFGTTAQAKEWQALPADTNEEGGAR